MIAADMDVVAAQNAPQYAATAGGRFRQGHATFLALLVVLNVCLDLMAFRPQGGQGMPVFWAGIVLAQTFLMGLWMAFGGLHPLLRGFLVVSITAGGTLAAAVSLESSFAGISNAYWQLAPIAGVAVFATHALLLPARLLLSWRIDFDPAYHVTGPNRRAQFRLLDCLGLMTAVALLLAFARLLNGELVKFAIVGGGAALLSSLPIVYLIVAPRRSDKTWMVAAIALAVFVVAEYLVFWAAFNGEAGILLPLHLGLVATLLLNLVPLRCLFGLHLFSVAPGARRYEVEPMTLRRTDAGLAALAAAWPTLPDEVRNQIVGLASVASAWPNLPESVQRQIVAATHDCKDLADC